MKPEEIVQILRNARDAYYNHGNSPLSDEEFDRLESELKSLEPRHPYFSAIGSETDAEEEKTTHVYPMLSANKVKNAVQLEDWMRRLSLPEGTSFILEPKIDGISASLLYREGKLRHIATRGDGIRGKNITYIRQYLNFLPPEIPTGDISGLRDVEIRGELFLPRNFQQEEESFSGNEDTANLRSLRNMAAGLIGRKDKRSGVSAVRFLAYQIQPVGVLPSESRKLEFLKNAGFPVIPYIIATAFSEMELYFNHYMNSLREEWEFETDGLIVSVGDNSLFEEINSRWVVDHHNHYAVAIKPPPSSRISTLHQILWQVSRLGNVIPVAVFDPVVIGGATIRRATLNNLANVKALKLAGNDRLKIERANDVIPYVAENLSHTEDNPGKKYDPDLIPSQCPSCASVLEEKETHLFCSNPECPEKIIQKIFFWAQKSQMDNIAEATIRSLYDRIGVRSIRDLYRLSREDILALEGFQEKKADNFIRQMQKSRKMDFQDFIASLGIPGVQRKSLQKLGILSPSDFISFQDDSYVIGKNILEWRSIPANAELFAELVDIMEFPQNVSTTEKPGVVFTGEGPMPRKELEKKAREMGFEPSGSVTKKTAVVVTSDPQSSSSKMKKAREWEIPVKTYPEFFSS